MAAEKSCCRKDANCPTESPKVTPTTYRAADPDLSIRAFLPQVQAAVSQRAVELVDVRSGPEFTGEILSPPGLPETCQRGGHIPGARSITWSKACNDDGTFKTFDELKALYQNEGITGRETDHCLLPHWRTIQSFLVCSEIPARLQGCEELRRLMD